MEGKARSHEKAKRELKVSAKIFVFSRASKISQQEFLFQRKTALSISTVIKLRLANAGNRKPYSTGLACFDYGEQIDTDILKSLD